MDASNTCLINSKLVDKAKLTSHSNLTSLGIAYGFYWK
jgi:hypothetical protein